MRIDKQTDSKGKREGDDVSSGCFTGIFLTCLSLVNFVFFFCYFSFDDMFLVAWHMLQAIVQITETIGFIGRTEATAAISMVDGFVQIALADKCHIRLIPNVMFTPIKDAIEGNIGHTDTSDSYRTLVMSFCCYVFRYVTMTAFCNDLPLGSIFSFVCVCVCACDNSTQMSFCY